MKNINPVKYVSFVGGFRPPTATNLLLPISSWDLFNGVKRKLILLSVFLFCIPAIVSASQPLPPEIPVLFYGNVKINNKPAAVNTVISAKTKADSLFNISDLISGQHECPDVQTTPSIKLDLAVDITDILADKQDAEINIAESAGNPIILAPSFCVKVIYDQWQEVCVNNWQYRNIISRIPNNCAITEEQKAQTKKKCGLADTNEEIKVLGAEFYPDNSLIRGSDMKIYLIENQTKRHIINLEALKQFAGREIFNVDDETINLAGIIKTGI